jgi:hypothetical protein
MSVNRHKFSNLLVFHNHNFFETKVFFSRVLLLKSGIASCRKSCLLSLFHFTSLELVVDQLNYSRNSFLIKQF